MMAGSGEGSSTSRWRVLYYTYNRDSGTPALMPIGDWAESPAPKVRTFLGHSGPEISMLGWQISPQLLARPPWGPSLPHLRFYLRSVLAAFQHLEGKVSYRSAEFWGSSSNSHSNGAQTRPTEACRGGGWGGWMVPAECTRIGLDPGKIAPSGGWEVSQVWRGWEVESNPST
jgi:hypothetical protein